MFFFLFIINAKLSNEIDLFFMFKQRDHLDSKAILMHFLCYGINFSRIEMSLNNKFVSISIITKKMYDLTSTRDYSSKKKNPFLRLLLSCLVSIVINKKHDV